MATNPNRQLAKLAVGLVSVAALAGITGRISASTGPARDGGGDNSTADAIQAPSGQDQGEQFRSFGSYGQGDNNSEDDNESGGDDGQQEYQRSRPTFAQPGSGDFTAPDNGSSQLPRRRTRHS